MAYLQCQRQNRVLTQIQIPNLMATFYYAVHVFIAQTWTWTRTPTPYFCTRQESEFESVPESVSGNVNESLEEQIRG